LRKTGGDVVEAVLKKTSTSPPVKVEQIIQSALIGPDGPDLSQDGRPTYFVPENFYSVREPTEVVMTYGDPETLWVEKVYTFYPDRFEIGLVIDVFTASGQKFNVIPVVSIKVTDPNPESKLIIRDSGNGALSTNLTPLPGANDLRDLNQKINNAENRKFLLVGDKRVAVGISSPSNKLLLVSIDSRNIMRGGLFSDEISFGAKTLVNKEFEIWNEKTRHTETYSLYIGPPEALPDVAPFSIAKSVLYTPVASSIQNTASNLKNALKAMVADQVDTLFTQDKCQFAPNGAELQLLQQRLFTPDGRVHSTLTKIDSTRLLLSVKNKPVIGGMELLFEVSQEDHFLVAKSNALPVNGQGLSFKCWSD